jgi:hypothetical protein
MPSTYEPIATTTLGSATSAVNFTSIPSSYTDLILVCNVVSFSSTGNVITAYLGNGSYDTGTNYSFTNIRGDGSSAASSRQSSTSLGAALFASTVGNGTGAAAIITHFQNYSNTTTFKTILSRGSQAGTLVDSNVSLWRSTVAINQIQVNSGVASMATGSTFTLYGIKAA